MDLVERPKPRSLRVGDNLSGLLAVKLGRKSTPDPRNPGKSVGDQLEGVDLACDRLGLIEAARIEEDRQGASAWSKTLFRAKFEEAMRIIETRDIAVFAVWSLSRSTRRTAVFGAMCELLDKRNTLLLIGDRLYDLSDATDRISLSVQNAVDENQVMVARKDTLRGLSSAARQGRPHGPHVYGYERVYNERTRALVSVRIVEPQAQIIRECADRIVSGESCHAIADDLTLRMLTSTPGDPLHMALLRPRGARRWYPQEVKDLVTSVTYLGKRSHTLWRTDITSLYEAMWEPILTPEQFDLCGAILAGRTNHASYRKDAKYMLTGIAKCGRCDGDQPMYGNRQGGLRRRPHEGMPMVYHCPVCRMSRSMEKVDRFVRHVVNAWIADPQIVAAYAQAASATDPEAARDREALAKAEAVMAEAYDDDTDLSPKGLALMERKYLPLIAELRRRVQASSSGQTSGWVDLRVAQLPNDPNEARLLLRRLVRVRILHAGRGIRFSPDQVSIEPLLCG